ncbi:hypothetical protein TNCV_2852061 [Trichonephila clavipes]|nr:hypothetical protein TNCV_2852061 [Trichonephila clavipes]
MVRWLVGVDGSQYQADSTKAPCKNSCDLQRDAHTVMRRSDNSKRLNWPLGRVIELYPGKDGIERVAKIRVVNGIVIKSLQRLYPLEMTVSDLPSDIA